MWYVLKKPTWIIVGKSLFSFRNWVLNFDELGKYILCLYHSMSFSHEYLEFVPLLFSTYSISFLLSRSFTYSIWNFEIHSGTTMDMAHIEASLSCFLDKLFATLLSLPFLYKMSKSETWIFLTHFCCSGEIFFWVRKYFRLLWSLLTRNFTNVQWWK